MPGSADSIQRAVHALEAGGAALWVRRFLILLAVVGLSLFYLIHEFRGLATSQAMDQAQIGRELMRGHGWATKFARPLAVGQLQRHGKNVARNAWIDTYNAPLPPLIDALALLPVRSQLSMTPSDIVFVGDKAIATMSILLFLASTAILFFLVRRLFDQTLAWLSCGLVLICDMLWQYSLSGLPQMLLLFLFHGALYALVRAIEAQENERPVGGWLAAVGAGFGCLALAHALTIWMFLPLLIFCGFYFRPRAWAAVLVLAPFLLLYTPWLLRNYFVCGNPGGVALYSFFGQIGMSEAGHMRQVAIDFHGMSAGFWRNKIPANLLEESGKVFHFFGWSLVAFSFFASLLHPFRRVETSALRWALLAMWLGAVAGMATYGVSEEEGVAANQLHLLFLPIMTAFGLAFLLVLWNRLGLENHLARPAFLSLLFLLCGLPMIFTFIGGSKGSIHWPPYVPPYIAVIKDWMQPNEITASDMPWAVAWYADRRAVYLPETIHAFTEFNDYNVLGGPLHGLYLTPVSGSQNTLRDILKGEYRDWAPVILRSVDLQKFPLSWATVVLGLENECVFFSDHDRQGINSEPGS